MANHISHAALPYPIKNAKYTEGIPYLDATGSPTDPTTPDTEISKDAGTFADCANEVTTIAGANGSGYLTLDGAEMNCALAVVCAKVASGPKATLAIFHPRDLPIIESGTATAGAATTIALGITTYNLAGCFVRTTGGTGGGGTGGANNQARRIMSHDVATGIVTVAPAWETTPDNTTTFDVLLPDGAVLEVLNRIGGFVL